MAFRWTSPILITWDAVILTWYSSLFFLALSPFLGHPASLNLLTLHRCRHGAISVDLWLFLGLIRIKTIIMINQQPIWQSPAVVRLFMWSHLCYLCGLLPLNISWLPFGISFHFYFFCGWMYLGCHVASPCDYPITTLSSVCLVVWIVLISTSKPAGLGLLSYISDCFLMRQSSSGHWLSYLSLGQPLAVNVILSSFSVYILCPLSIALSWSTTAISSFYPRPYVGHCCRPFVLNWPY